MKLGVTIAGKHALPSAFVVWRGFEESIAKAAEYGYDGVELALKSADEIDPGELRGWLDRYGMEVSAISTGQIYADTGLCFTHPDAAVREKTVEVFRKLVLLANDFGRTINIGRVRGGIAPGQTAEQAENLFLDTVRMICRYGAEYGLTIILEPVNRYEINFINNLDEGAALLEKIGCDNCGLMPDTFHMNIEDDRIADSLVRNRKWVRYIHMADSNRLAPGKGHIDFQEIFAALKKIGYQGWLTAEILPKPSDDQAAREAVTALRELMRGAGER